ncbi:MAG TPA: alcohol dehydrogenase catalytic domain-containing protein [Ktedonobacteraceae bacterium]|nr:alcohol dehydrogenase catalytic domain-containing protein [Ktedonobacteraceae bacterium]
MKAIIYHSYDDIRLENRSIPTISDDELLVRVHGCGLCGSDILKIAQQAPPPVILGHELTGTIVERGKAISNFEIGQRVVVAHHVPCGSCHYCRHHNYSMCAAFKTSNIDPCGFAEYIRVPAAHARHTTLALPATLSNEEGSFVEPLACCVRAVQRTPLLPGDSVVVMGLGSVGLLILQAVKALAEVQAFGIDLLPERLQIAREFGADAVFQAPSDEHALRDLLNPLTEGRGADALILTAPGARPFMQAAASARKGGTITIFAAHSGAASLNLESIYQQELTITSAYSSSPETLRTALDLLAARRVLVDRLISHRLPLERFNEGVSQMREHKALKVYFQIGNNP